MSEIEASIELMLRPGTRRDADKKLRVEFAVPATSGSDLSDAVAVRTADGTRLVLKQRHGRLYLPFDGDDGWYDRLRAEEGATPETFRGRAAVEGNNPISQVLVEYADNVRVRTGLPKGHPDRATAFTRKAAMEHFLFVDGRLHRRLLEPVWQRQRNYVAPNFNALFSMQLKVHPSGYERIPTEQFRFDRREAALAFLRRSFARTRAAELDDELVGEVEILGDFEPRDDEVVRCVKRHGETFVRLSERALGTLSDDALSDWCTMRDELATIRQEGRAGADRFSEAFGRIVAEAKSAPRDSEAIRNLASGRWYIDQFLDRIELERQFAPALAVRFQP